MSNVGAQAFAGVRLFGAVGSLIAVRCFSDEFCLRFGGSGDADALPQIRVDPRDPTVEALMDAALGRTKPTLRKAMSEWCCNEF